ncbi:Aste57867_13203 [Aphanomyces stellatus]|uniref:Aste57867_13203 protein n=1 Tax=Aphanomyces stellatus TaxID=120398 RepID=A0A485KXI9_9STRA|nr:hypothetical protein As57867_013154 [Aphanomyces stellatus]VFT90043.1 Aste57867_13203 [Aphanomyces stellatus]
MRLVVVLAAMAAIVTVSAKGNKNSKVDRMWRMQKKSCEENECRHLDSMTNMNCLHECISGECYGEVYASLPLEDGEVDDYRYNKYLQCIRKDYRSRSKKARESSRDEL